MQIRTFAWGVAAVVLAFCPALHAQDGVDLRPYPGVVAYIDNSQGKAFDIDLAVREWNLLEDGPREMLLKVYAPDGTLIERRVIEDDGIASEALLPEAGGWDHEMWYYALCYGRGSKPMLRWSSFSDARRIRALPARTFHVPVADAGPGVYRVLLVGTKDHVATLNVSGGLRYAVGGTPLWLHGHGDLYRRSYVYIPRGTTAVSIGVAEYDRPATRQFRVTAPDGSTFWEGAARGGFQTEVITLDEPGRLDDQLLTVDVSEGAGDYMLHMQLSRSDFRNYRGPSGVPALFAPDPETARAVRGGAIYHDGEVFWHPFQVRFHEWLKTLDEDDYVVRDAEGNVIEQTAGSQVIGYAGRMPEYKGLPARENFYGLNGRHETPPVSDVLMHSYGLHKNRATLNISLRDLAGGLRHISVGDTVMPTRWVGNMAYVFASYRWHYWRPAWRILQQTDAPEEVKAILREAMILCGDRLAFANEIERVNGNAFAHIPMSLQYVALATGDPIQRQLADTYIERFTTEGWGRGSGIGPSGDCQEHFAHDYHYGAYMFETFRGIIADTGDERFKNIYARAVDLYGYLYCPDVVAAPWSSRVHYGVSAHRIDSYGVEYQGLPGPDFTVNVNGGSEWFAARRPDYYALTFHGRLAPMWLDYYFASRLGYGGGALCQVAVPGRGTVIASTLNEKYGRKNRPREWRDFHIHGLVGELADGRPLVAADSIHADARLEGNRVQSSGEVRDRPIHVARSYAYEADRIECEVVLSDTDMRAAYWNVGYPSDIALAYEMIPFVAEHNLGTDVASRRDPANIIATKVLVAGEDGTMQPLTDVPVECRGVTIDCSGYGVRVELPEPMTVHRGANDTVMILLARAGDEPVPVDQVAVRYTLVPFRQ